jgi:hypothetical protein
MESRELTIGLIRGTDLIEVHNQMVMELVPKERLLVMSLKEGWEPLCKFLNKPIPDEPFPRTNDASAADSVAKGVFGKLLLQWIAVFGVTGYGTYAAANFARSL